MRLKSGIIFFAMLAAIQLSLWIPVNAGAYDVSDVALTPGRDITQLNIAWHHSDNECDCVVEVAENTGRQKRKFGKGAEFRGTNAFIGLDENSAATYACEVTVSGLENQTDYVYRLGNDRGEWSDIYEYATRDRDGYGFFFVADSQIGASAPNARSGDIRAVIAEHQARKMYPDLSDGSIKVLVEACTSDAPTDTLIGLTELEEAIDLLYNSFSTDTTDKLLNLKVLDPDLAKEILALQVAATREDAKGWEETVGIMTENFPEAAFILSAGDQVETSNREYEYTGFFSSPELTSLPVAPVLGNHEREAINFDHHFNLPNESSEYGVNNASGDYYFSYGDVLFMVLNMEPTASAFPQESAPGGPPPGPSSSRSGQNMDRAASGGSQREPSRSGRSGRPPGGPPPPGQDVPLDSEEEFKLALSELEQYRDEKTGEPQDKLQDFKKSIADHQTFMKEAVAANPDAEWKVVMWHYSIYSAGSHAADDVIRAMRHYMVPVLEDLDIDVVLMGHDHCFARTYQMLGDDPQLEQKVDRNGRIINPTGILYFTANSSSGSKYYELNRKYDVADDPDTPETEGPHAYFEYLAVTEQLKRPLFSHIAVDHDSLKISTYTLDMEMIDSYAIVKESEKP